MIRNIDAFGHVRGTSVYLDDLPEQSGTLHGVVFDAQVAHAQIENIDLDKARSFPGVIAILTHNDIPGENQIGGIIPDEPLLAEDEIHFWGMPIALVIGESEYAAKKAVELIELKVTKRPVITDPRIAAERGQLISDPRTFILGDVDAAWKNCANIIEGRVDSNGQEHLYIETQGAYARPAENGGIVVSSSTQGPTAVQRTVARVLGVPMHKIEVDVTRLGGGFGGKEDQATAWAVMSALAAKVLNRPVKFVPHRMDDMRITGKRHPYSSDFKIGLSSDLKILAYEATFYQNAGAAADLSPAVLERTLYHATNSYYIPNVRARAYSCKTNLPPNTAFRGFGGPQGMFVIESAIRKLAEQVGVNASEIQSKNLLEEGDVFPYGQRAQKCEALNSWNSAVEKFDLERMMSEVSEFNLKNAHVKKGLAVMPVCFGISFTNTPMNHARALVHVYQDGSIGISTGGVEMGQGLNTKMMQVAMDIFSVGPERVKIESTNTTRIANTSPSAASSTADLNGKALEMACLAILVRLKKVAADHLEGDHLDVTLKDEKVLISNRPTQMDWTSLVRTAFLARISLSEHSHYATPGIHYDKKQEKGEPFAYHVYGTAIVCAEVDCIRGRYTFDYVKLTHDFGKSLNKTIDYGQVEGGLIQGIGWMTMEEVVYNEEGKLLSNALSTYKVPDIYSVPAIVEIEDLDSDGHHLAIRRSKAVGEPPLMYGIGAYFAIQNAVAAFHPGYKLHFDAPFTPEKVLTALYVSADET